MSDQDDDDPDDDHDDEDDEDEDDEDEDDEDGDDEDDEDGETEGRAARAPRGSASTSASTFSSEAPAQNGAGISDPVGATYTGAPRASRVGIWLSLEDPRVDQLVLLSYDGRRLSIARRPFPQSPEQWILGAYGPGRYRLVQRDDRGKHLGSRTIYVGAAGAQGPTLRTVLSAPPAPEPQASIAPGTDWKLAAVTALVPIVGKLIDKLGTPPSALPHSELDTVLKVAELLKVPNQERAQLFSEGMKVMRELAPERGEGSPFNVRDLLAGIGDVVQTFRQNAAAAPAPSTPSQPTIGARAAAPSTPESDAAFVERVLFTEINRAVSTGDDPEPFVILLGAWVPQSTPWIVMSEDHEVLEELKRRYPHRAEFLEREQVKAFLLRAIQMIREDANAPLEEGEGESVSSAAGAEISS